MGSSLYDDIKQVAQGWRWSRRSLTPRSAEPFQDEPERKEFSTEWARTPAGRAAREFVHRAIMKPIYFNEVSPTIEGADNLDLVTGPVIFVSNHSSHLDAGLIMSSLPKKWRRNTATGAAADYFFDTWWKSLATGLVYNAFPIDRGGRGQSIPTARRLLNEGWNLLVFPEGTRTPDGWMQRFRHGTARMCVEYGVPVVPIGITGSYAAMPKGSSWPKGGRPPVLVRFGEAVHPDPGETHNEFSRRMTQAVSQLIDEDRTTWWESLKRASRGGTPPPTGPQGPKWLRVWEGSKSPARRGPKRAWKR